MACQKKSLIQICILFLFQQPKNVLEVPTAAANNLMILSSLSIFGVVSMCF